MKNTVGVILAAGKGSRMQSDLPKVLHRLEGKTFLRRVSESLLQCGIAKQVVVTNPEIFSQLKADSELFGPAADAAVFTWQKNQKGTGDALASAGFALEGVELPSYAAGENLGGLTSGSADNSSPIEAENMLVVMGDMPKIDAGEMAKFIEACEKSGSPLGMMAMHVPGNSSYGRVVTDSEDRLIKVVEMKDASEDERTIELCNTGILFGRTKLIFEILSYIGNDNKSGEYYLTDCFSIARQKRISVFAFTSHKAEQFVGINTQEELRRIATP